MSSNFKMSITIFSLHSSKIKKTQYLPQMTSPTNNGYLCKQLKLNKAFSIFIMFHYCAVHLKKDINSYHHIPSCHVQ